MSVQTAQIDHEQLISRLKAALPRTLAGTRAVLDGMVHARGSHHTSYLLTIQTDDGGSQQVIARLPLVDKPSHRLTMHQEHAVLQHLAQVGFGRAPRSYLHDATFVWMPVPYSVQSFVETAPATSLAEGQLLELAGTLVELHSLDVSDLFGRGFSSYQTWHAIASMQMRSIRDWMRQVIRLSSYERIGPILVEAWHTVDAVIQSMSNSTATGQARPILTHGDLGSHNLGWSSSGLYLYDWESAAIGDPAYDLAKFLRSSVRSDHLRNVFLQAYLSALGRSASTAVGEDFLQRIERYELISALHMAVWALGQMELAKTHGQDVEGDSPRNRAFLLDSLAAIDLDFARAAAAALQTSHEDSERY